MNTINDCESSYRTVRLTLMGRRSSSLNQDNHNNNNNNYNQAAGDENPNTLPPNATASQPHDSVVETTNTTSSSSSTVIQISGEEIPPQPNMDEQVTESESNDLSSTLMVQAMEICQVSAADVPIVRCTNDYKDLYYISALLLTCFLACCLDVPTQDNPVCKVNDDVQPVDNKSVVEAMDMTTTPEIRPVSILNRKSMKER